MPSARAAMPVKKFWSPACYAANYDLGASMNVHARACPRPRHLQRREPPGQPGQSQLLGSPGHFPGYNPLSEGALGMPKNITSKYQLPELHTHTCCPLACASTDVMVPVNTIHGQKLASACMHKPKIESTCRLQAGTSTTFYKPASRSPRH